MQGVYSYIHNMVATAVDQSTTGSHLAALTTKDVDAPAVDKQSSFKVAFVSRNTNTALL